jgi:hypothetical protein
MSNNMNAWSTNHKAKYLQEFKKAVLSHPDQGKLACCAMSNGAMYPECAAELQRIHQAVIAAMGATGEIVQMVGNMSI